LPDAVPREGCSREEPSFPLGSAPRAPRSSWLCRTPSLTPTSSLPARGPHGQRRRFWPHLRQTPSADPTPAPRRARHGVARARCSNVANPPSRPTPRPSRPSQSERLTLPSGQSAYKGDRDPVRSGVLGFALPTSLLAAVLHPSGDSPRDHATGGSDPARAAHPDGGQNPSYRLSSLYHWKSAEGTAEASHSRMPFCPTGTPVLLASEMYGGSAGEDGGLGSVPGSPGPPNPSPCSSSSLFFPHVQEGLKIISEPVSSSRRCPPGGFGLMEDPTLQPSVGSSEYWKPPPGFGNRVCPCTSPKQLEGWPERSSGGSSPPPRSTNGAAFFLALFLSLLDFF